MAAARRAAAKVAAADPPPAPPEPTPQPEPEPESLLSPEKNLPQEDDEIQKSSESLRKEGTVKERIIERIIICPGGQDPYMNAYPTTSPQSLQFNYCPCLPKKKNKKRKKKEAGEELCQHRFCIVQRRRNRPGGLPWATTPPPKPPVVVCQRPVLCCSCRTESMEDDEDSEDVEDSNPTKSNPMNFMNMVFAATSAIKEREGASSGANCQ